MSKFSLVPGTIAINEKGELGVIQTQEATRYVGISLSQRGKITSEGFDGNPFTYTGGKEWSSENPQMICHTDDLRLLGEKMYTGEEVPVELPELSNIDGYICFCSNPILGVGTSDKQGLTDMGNDRWPGYHLTTGEVLKKNFKGKDIDYAFTAGGPWSSSQPRPIVKVSDLEKVGAVIHNWAQNELACV